MIAMVVIEDVRVGARGCFQQLASCLTTLQQVPSPKLSWWCVQAAELETLLLVTKSR